jgi:molybdopterin/thiamine biosynthesis adenylyltransferase
MRYSRHLLMDDIGEAGQQKLSQARVLIVGLGGLGCPVALYLAAAGVGHLSLCDPDVVELSNLQRQILYRETDCDQHKVECAERELRALNPHIGVSSYATEITDELIGNQDIVVDCTDNLAARQLINNACHRNKVGFVSASALGWEGQLVAFDFATHGRLSLN